MKKAIKTRSSVTTARETVLPEVETYLAAVPEPARSTLQNVRAVIQSVAPPGSTEALGYGIPTFRYKGALVAYAAFKAHCSFFPMSASLIEEFAEDLKDYSLSKGTIRFPVDRPLPPKLIKKLVKARVAQNEKKNAR